MVQYCGTDHAFEGQLVVATSAPELLAGEEEQAAADASLSRAPPSATADTLTSDELLSPIFVPMFLPGYTAPRPTPQCWEWASNAASHKHQRIHGTVCFSPQSETAGTSK
jgi:hypothetical protein